MRRLYGLTTSALLALWMVGAAACGDDDKKHETAEDGGPLTGPDGAVIGVGMDGAILGRPDGSTVAPDGAIVAPDGAIIGQLEDSGASTMNDAAAPPAGPCPGGCDDGVDCTTDRCANNVCTHAVDDTVCTGAQSCSLTKGCQAGTKTCANNMDCTDMDGCTTNERCDGALKVCKTDVLDGDADGFAPASCGGADCNDANGQVGPGEPETCDGLDNDCDGTVDDGATCLDDHAVCSMGNCNTCAAGFTRCNGQCVDLQTDPNHCGACQPGMMHPDVTCGAAGVCAAGACSCPPADTMCGNNCVDTKVSTTSCGGCNMPCTGTMQQPQSCFDAVCTDCGRAGQTCCQASASVLNPVIADKDGCYGALTCSGTQGAAASKCGCAAGATMCGMTCTDTSTDFQNCGACGNACQGAQVCQKKGETSACVSCGNAGEPCCDLGIGIGVCRNGTLVCGSNGTCVRGGVPTPGGPGAGN